MSTKLTPSLIKTVQSMRENGYSYADIQRETKLSAGSVANACKGGKKPSVSLRALKVPSVSTVSDNAAAPPATPHGNLLEHEDLRGYLSDQVRALRDACTSAQGAGDAEGYARASRNLTSATALLAKLTPQPVEADPDGVWVDGDKMRETATATRAKLHDLLTRILDEPAEPTATATA